MCKFLLGIQPPILPYTTLNEKFSIQAGVTPTPQITGTQAVPPVALRYIAIGDRGHSMIANANNTSQPVTVPHSPADTALYNHLPFQLVLATNDLSPDIQKNYRLRRKETWHGTDYIAYYLKVLPIATVQPQLQLRNVNNGTVTTTAYTPVSGNLNPPVPTPTAGSTLVATGSYVAATATIPFTLSADEVTAFMNVCNIIYGNAGYAMISELALCTGIDGNVSIPGGAVYTEAFNVQVASFINTFMAVAFSNNGVSITLDVGSVSPMMALKPAG